MRWKLVAAGAVVIAAIWGVGFVAGGSHEYTVSGYFVNAERIVAQNDVTINGQVVGQVTDVQLVPEDRQQDGGALITMQIDSKYAPLHQGTRAEIKPKGLLGSMYIVLHPAGAANPALPSGGVIPLHDTSAPVMLDEVQDVFDPNTQYWIKILTVEGGKTFANNRGQDLNNLLAALPSIASNASSVTGTLAARDQQLDQLDVEFDQIAYQMAIEDQSLRNDLSSGSAILNTLAAHDQQLQNELVYANAALGQLNGALNGHQQDLNTTLKEFPGLLLLLQEFELQSSSTLTTIYPCIGDVLNTLAEMQAATAYQHPAGSSNGFGNMLRVYPVLTGPPVGGNEAQSGSSFTPAAAQCQGSPAP
jgi:phospholipid/cholesterol/gamma-HCH transport system substrate-binding protein